MHASPINPSVVRLHHHDNVVVAVKQLIPGQSIESENLIAHDLIPAGHKIATRNIVAQDAVLRYNQVIGFATRDIMAGEHVHTHNVKVSEFSRTYDECLDPQPFVAHTNQAQFMGYKRKNGKVGTRNYLAVIASVNCSSTVARAISNYFSSVRLSAFKNVDGVIALPQALGCGMNMNGEGLAVLRRTLVGYANHPNICGVLFVGLGCEHNQIDALIPQVTGLEASMLQSVSIQEEGGTSAAIIRGIHLLDAMLEQANAYQREQLPISHLIVGLNCGGSDGYSGITANPALGGASDMLAAHGATTILSETPEIYGAEHLLARRAQTPEIARMLIERIDWWREYTASTGGEMDNNPSVGNKAGGSPQSWKSLWGP